MYICEIDIEIEIDTDITIYVSILWLIEICCFYFGTIKNNTAMEPLGGSVSLT